MNASELILRVYRCLKSKSDKSGAIPVNMRPATIVGTVQDDPFDCWIEDEIRSELPDNYEIFHSGKLTTPDLVIRDKKSGTIIGLEIKKLIQQKNGQDSRGLTMDYNSCLPCGRTMVKVGGETIIVPCYYLFALLNITSTKIVTLIILDGDFLNYDFELHKEAKYANYSEYGHGPYGEGSVRHRKMYTYPNPLNSKIEDFFLKRILIVKKNDIQRLVKENNIIEQIIRKDKYNNSFYYYLIDETRSRQIDGGVLKTLTNIFDQCKKRQEKERTASIPDIPAL